MSAYIRKPQAQCACGAFIKAGTKRCSPCSADQKNALNNAIKRRQRALRRAAREQSGEEA